MKKRTLIFSILIILLAVVSASCDSGTATSATPTPVPSATAVSDVDNSKTSSEIETSQVFSIVADEDSVYELYGGQCEVVFGSVTAEVDPILNRPVAVFAPDTQMEISNHMFDSDNCEEYSVEMYVYFKSTDAGASDEQYIFNITNGDCFCIFESGFLTFNAGNVETNLAYNLDGKKLLDQWVHIVYTVKENLITMYVNGEYAKASEQAWYLDKDKSSDDIYMGTYWGINAPDRYAVFNIYDEALSDEQVLELYNSAK